jgi:hypothetical protein
MPLGLTSKLEFPQEGRTRRLNDQNITSCLGRSVEVLLFETGCTSLEDFQLWSEPQRRLVNRFGIFLVQTNLDFSNSSSRGIIRWSISWEHHGNTVETFFPCLIQYRAQVCEVAHVPLADSALAADLRALEC